MSYKTYATIGAISLAFLLGIGSLAPMSALAHNQTMADCEEGQILVDGGHGKSGNQHCADPEPSAPVEEEEENGNEEQGNNNSEDESTTYVLQVNSRNLQGDPITGYFTVIELDGEEVFQGFTPVEFPGNNGLTYAVTVHDFDGVTFHHWDDNSTERTRMVTLDADTIITAYYTVPSNGEEEVEDEVPQQTTERKGKNWAGAIKFSEQLLNYGFTAANIPESDTQMTTYEATTGPLGMNLFDILDGLALSGIEWSKLTGAQKIWLLENFHSIMSGEQ